MSEQRKAFPVSAPTMDHGMYLIDYFACHAPKPDQNDVESELRRDKASNPHNDPHKDKIRSKKEIKCDLRYQWAKTMMQSREKWI